VVLFVTIDDGWHIHPNTVEADWQIPTRLTMTSKQGTKLIDVQYLAASPSASSAAQRNHCPCMKKRRSSAALSRSPSRRRARRRRFGWSSAFNPATKDVCKAPTNVTLAAKIPVAAVGEPVKEKNANLFRK